MSGSSGSATFQELGWGGSIVLRMEGVDRGGLGAFTFAAPGGREGQPKSTAKKGAPGTRDPKPLTTGNRVLSKDEGEGEGEGLSGYPTQPSLSQRQLAPPRATQIPYLLSY